MQQKGFKPLCSQGDIDQVARLHDSQLHATNMRVVLNTDGPSSAQALSPTSSPPFDTPSSSPNSSPPPVHPQLVSITLLGDVWSLYLLSVIVCV